jgi:membrane-associated protein
VAVAGAGLDGLPPLLVEWMSGLAVVVLKPSGSRSFKAITATTPTRFVVLWAAVAAGSVVGESVGYGIGRRFAALVQASRIGRWLGQERWARAAEFLQRRAPARCSRRFLAAVHAVLPIVAGTVRMGYRRFVVACVAGALVWWCCT